LDDYRRFADEVRERSGGIPIGYRMSARHIEQDIDDALAEALAHDGPALVRVVSDVHPGVGRRAWVDRAAGSEWETQTALGRLSGCPRRLRCPAHTTSGRACTTS
jgi:hypothetical protein